MPKKIPEEKVEEMVRLYNNGFSIGKISKQLHFDYTTVKRNLEKKGIKFKTKKDIEICIVCRKTFKPHSAAHKYCHNPCNPRYFGKGKERALRYHYIKLIRSDFYRRIKDNPAKALQIEKDMIDEEGQEFTDMVLNGITDTPEFDEAVKMYIKYKKVWDKK